VATSYYYYYYYYFVAASMLLAFPTLLVTLALDDFTPKAQQHFSTAHAQHSACRS
jgi:hypothetical protein